MIRLESQQSSGQSLALSPAQLSVALLTREYPPENYGGAGVHVEYLARELKRRIELGVYCFGAPRSAEEVKGTFAPWDLLAGSAPELQALRTLSVNLLMTKAIQGCSLSHSHTWYANFAGHLAKLSYGMPHVMTSHSLEPLRPWKAEQLRGGYAISSWCESTAIHAADAVVAVSQGMKADILRAYPGVDPSRVHVIYNGVDPNEFVPKEGRDVLARYGIDPAQPYAVFVGRVTRQKGIVHLLRAGRYLKPGSQLVLCAGEADTPELGQEVRGLVDELKSVRGGVIWIEKMLSRPELSQILSNATVFCCPSVYEPFGIVNLEAMACGAAVVASKVGGIPEIVVDGQTGYLVPFEADGTARAEPKHPEVFAQALAEKLDLLLADPTRAREFGAAGRRRVVETFSWSSIAEQTIALYQDVLARTR
ncbi:MAG TPA: glycogen synthase [Polyangiaceae bacterium]|nr:glycogen synthase [Polyangiaceae bacterium]